MQRRHSSAFHPPREVEALIARAASCTGRVVVRGAPGTGKKRVARRIHALSDRAAAPLVQINLPREPDIRPALATATGAVGEGTLVIVGLERLDEAAQEDLAKTLRGDFAGRLVVTCGPVADDLRADLMAAHAGLTIPIPPLCDRPKDAVWMAQSLLPKPLSGDVPRLSALAEAALRAHDWPDNGREARSRVMQALESAQQGMIQPADLFPERRLTGAFPTLAEAREAAERNQILAALASTGGQVAEAARQLSVSRTTLWEKMQKLGL